MDFISVHDSVTTGTNSVTQRHDFCSKVSVLGEFHRGSHIHYYPPSVPLPPFSSTERGWFVRNMACLGLEDEGRCQNEFEVGR